MRKLTVAEAAQKAGVGERKIKEWMDCGILDYSRVDNFFSSIARICKRP